MLSKKLYFGLLFLGLLILGLTPMAAQELGDVDNNGSVNIVDALMIAHYFVGPPFFIDEELADVNCDGKVTIVDALIVAQYYVGIIDHFPCTQTVTVSHIRGIQCEITYYDTEEEARLALSMSGVHVISMTVESMMVNAVCGNFDGITYIATIPLDDLAAAQAIGWN